MKRLDLSHYEDRFCKSVFVNNFLLDEDIFKLQEIFLHRGFHYISVSSVLFGRNLLNIFFKLLDYYHNKAFLSVIPFFSNSMLNLYDKFLIEGVVSEIEYLENFMLTSFYYDFLVIELTDEIAMESWFLNFQNYLVDFNFIETLSVIVFLYS